MKKRRTFDLPELADALASPAWERTAREPCLAPERVWEAACGRLAAAELAAIADHVAICPGCAHELRAARQMADELDEIEPLPVRETSPSSAPDPPAGVVPSPRGGTVVAWTPWATAAAVAAAACVAVVVMGPPGPDPLVSRAPIHWSSSLQQRAESAVPSVRLLVPDGQALPRGRFVLRWQPLEDARYDVRVMTTELDEVAAASDLTAARWRLTEEELARFPEGTTLLWQVEAYLPDGERIPSPTFQVRLE